MNLKIIVLSERNQTPQKRCNNKVEEYPVFYPNQPIGFRNNFCLSVIPMV